MESTDGSEAGAIFIMHDDGDEDDGKMMLWRSVWFGTAGQGRIPRFLS